MVEAALEQQAQQPAQAPEQVDPVRPPMEAMALSVSIMALAVVGFGAVGLYWDWASMHNAMLSIRVAGNVGVDVFGAVVPLIAAFACAAMYLRLGFSKSRLALSFAASLAFSFALSHMSTDGLMGHPLMLALLSSLAASVLAFSQKPLLQAKGKFAASLLAALVCVPSAVVVTDVAYVPSMASATVGGSGLTDGILVAALYAPLWAGLLAAFATMILLVAGYFQAISAWQRPTQVPL